jgi:cytochrome c peroxidase
MHTWQKEVLWITALVFLAFSCQKLSPEPGHDPDPSGFVDPHPISEPAYIPPAETGPYALELPWYYSRKFTIPESNPLTKEGVQLGRMLFYEKRLSGNNTMSCNSCHQQKLAFTDGKAFSKGIAEKAGRRSSMSLVNLLWVPELFWDGRSRSLEEQALIPIEDPVELHQSLQKAVQKLQHTSFYPERFRLAFGSDIITAENIGRALAQFQRTLISSNSRYDQHLRGEYQLTPQERNGMNLFFTHPEAETGLRGANCGDCHGSHLTTLNTFHNNGLDVTPKDPGRKLVTQRQSDLGRFRAPTMRNIALTAPYMHDGRFTTLEEVLDHYNEHIQTSPTLDPLIIEASNEPNGRSLLLTEEEKKDVIAFLHLLTDSTFIQDKKFSNPFLP